MNDFITELVNFLTAPATLMSVLRFVLAIVVIFVGCKLVRVFTRKIVESRAMSRFNKTMRTFLGHVISICFYIVIVIIGALILGTGMSLCLTNLGAALGSLAMVVGIAVGLVGMVLVALAYPLYNRVLKKQREKIAPEILRLSDELLK